MGHPSLLPDPEALHLHCIETEAQIITLLVSTSKPAAACPVCQQKSQRVHSHYQRLVADLPWMDYALRLRLRTRRFFCENKECPRQIFTERLPSVVAPSARKTCRLTELVRLIGFVVGGEAGKRLCHKLHLCVSADTLLRLVRTAPAIAHATPRVLGVDDFCFCKRKRYGTLLIDLEKRLPVEMLPDREASTLSAWLKEHPEVKVISRDRSGPYAEAARQGAPQAQQVADRWHLLQNLHEMLSCFFLNKRAALKALVQRPKEEITEHPSELAPWYARGNRRTGKRNQQLHQEQVERFHKIHDLHTKKVDTANIARQVGVSRRTVYWYLGLKQPPQLRSYQRDRPSVIDPYKGYLIQRWNEGCRNAQQVYREIVAVGYKGSAHIVSRYFAQFRQRKDQYRKFKSVDPSTEQPVKVPPRRPPTAPQVAHWNLCAKEQLEEWQQNYLEQLRANDQEIAQVTDLVQEFTCMLRERQGERLDQWMEHAQAQSNVLLRNFALGLQRDYEAVKAGLTLPWSNGQVEGQVHRLKFLKRQSYGRAGFQLLRAKVLYRG